jgi:hypothetical protein
MRVGAAPPVDDEALLGRKATSKDFELGTWVIGLLGKHCRAPEFARTIYLLLNNIDQ